MNNVLIFIAKMINRVFHFSMGKKRYFNSWSYLYRISLYGMGRIQGNPIEKSGEIHVIRNILQTGNDPILIMDVGANKGQYTDAVLAQRVMSNNLELHLFEPSGFNAAYLKEIFTEKKYPGQKFVINQLALSNKNEIAYLYTDSEGSDLGSLLQLKTPIRPFDDNIKEEIKTTTLDDYIFENNLKRIDLLKIDVEGGEYLVFTGGLKALESGRIKNIQFEFGAGNITSRIFFHDFWELLSGNYYFSLILDGGLVPIKEYSTEWEIFRTVNYFLTLK